MRTKLYKKKSDNLSNSEKALLLDEILALNHQVHWELMDYKEKRKERAQLLKTRLASPQTKTMKKKLSGKKISLKEYQEKAK